MLFTLQLYSNYIIVTFEIFLREISIGCWIGSSPIKQAHWIFYRIPRSTNPEGSYPRSSIPKATTEFVFPLKPPNEFPNPPFRFIYSLPTNKNTREIFSAAPRVPFVRRRWSGGCRTVKLAGWANLHSSLAPH